MRTALICCVALRVAAAATAPLLYAPIDRQVCVPTVTDDGAGPSFCVDFVREDLFEAVERFCDETNVCSGHEAGALAYAARRGNSKTRRRGRAGAAWTIPGTRVRGRPLDYC